MPEDNDNVGTVAGLTGLSDTAATQHHLPTATPFDVAKEYGKLPPHSKKEVQNYAAGLKKQVELSQGTSESK